MIGAHERLALHLDRPTADHLATIRELRGALRLALAEPRAEAGRAASA